MTRHRDDWVSAWRSLAGPRLAALLSASGCLTVAACDVPCGEGTVLVDGVCVAAPDEADLSLRWGSAPAFDCGTGTFESDGVCIQDLAVICKKSCGAGTMQLDGECIADMDIICGPGTVDSDGTCFADIVEACDDPCGADAVAVDGSCRCVSCSDSDYDGVCDEFDACHGYPEYDDPDGDGLATGCDICPFDVEDDCLVLRAFVTSEGYPGDFGYAGADAICQGLAENAGLAEGGEQFRALLTGAAIPWPVGSFSIVDVHGRLVWATPWGQGPVTGIGGLPLTGTLSTDEHGQYAGDYAWTGSTQRPYSPGDCSGWSGIGWGRVGNPGWRDAWWDVASSLCSELARLYCVEVG